METLLRRWKRERRTIGYMSDQSLVSLEGLRSDGNKRTFGERLNIAMDKFFEPSNTDREGEIKPN